MTAPAPNRTRISLGTVLVVGGCGFLGHNIVDQLLNFPSETDPSVASQGEKDARANFPTLRERFPEYDARVHVTDLRVNHNRLPGAEYHEGDITSVESMLEVFRKVKPDVVIHTASPEVFRTDKELLHKVNVGGTRTLLEVARGDHGNWGGQCKAFVYTSSASVIHDAFSPLINAKETWPLIRGKLQGVYYTDTKAEADELVLQANRKDSKMLTCAIRPAGIFGEADTAVSKNILHLGLTGSNLKVRLQLGDNNNLFDFTYVANVAYAHALAAHALLTSYARYEAGQAEPLDHERVDGEAFNITNDEPIYFWDFARGLWAHAGRVVDTSSVIPLPVGALSVIGTVVETIYGFLGKTPSLTKSQIAFSSVTRYYSCQKAIERLGYRAIVPLEEGITRAARYFAWTVAAARDKKEQ